MLTWTIIISGIGMLVSAGLVAWAAIIMIRQSLFLRRMDKLDESIARNLANWEQGD